MKGREEGGWGGGGGGGTETRKDGAKESKKGKWVEGKRKGKKGTDGRKRNERKDGNK